MLDQFEEQVRPHQPELFIGIESRGFLTAVPMVNRMELGMITVKFTP